MDLKKLLTRAISGLIYCGIIIICTIAGTPYVALMSAVFGTLAVIEIAKMMSGDIKTHLPALLLDIAGCIALCYGIYILPILLWLLVIICRLTEELYLKEKDPIHSLTISIFSQTYVGIPLGCAVAISYLSPRPEALLAVFFFLWINDTGAYITGSLFGRHKLFERISPKKSWEGFVGGFMFNLIAAALFAIYCPGFFGLGHNIWFWIGMAVIVTVFGTWGDLVESLIKRSANVKDSGNIIPGHGGILDRIDSLLLSAPAVLIYIVLAEII